MESKTKEVFYQRMTISKRALKHISKRGKSDRLVRPTYLLTIKSFHSMDQTKYALICITIPRTTAEALIKDHAAEWDTTIMGYMG